jgi:hypothetical protein
LVWEVQESSCKDPTQSITAHDVSQVAKPAVSKDDAFNLARAGALPVTQFQFYLAGPLSCSFRRVLFVWKACLSIESALYGNRPS